jgi:hypothetical protein
MKLVIDKQLVDTLSLQNSGVEKNAVLLAPHTIDLRWPTFLESLGLGSILQSLPDFTEKCIAKLKNYEDNNALYHLFDGLFAENLTQIKSMPELNAPYLIQAIADHEIKPWFSEPLEPFKRRFIENPKLAMHDLILYLGWDRMCIAMSRIWDHQSPDPEFQRGIEVLKDCLIESFQHIHIDGRTAPSLYRLFEALFFYYMREENIQKHTDEEWALLNQGFQILKSPSVLADIFYIDDMLLPEQDQIYITLDLEEKVNIRLAFAKFMMSRLKIEVPSWNFQSYKKEVVSLKKYG